MRPDFSVVTSFYGEGENYVYRLYEDIKKQSVDWEWIITDDFSTCEKTAKAIADVAGRDHRVKLIFQKRKREIFSDPQKYATGKFVFHIDADDRVHPSYLLHCEYWFRRFPSVICILSGSEWVNENGVFNRFTFHRNSELEVKHDFVGRVWRNGFDFKFEEVFTNVNDIIRTNDMFIVKSLETVGDILCLPRAYIRYEMRSNSNCNIQRTPEEKEKIERCKKEFFSWLSVRKIESPYDPYFFDSELDIIVFLGMGWEGLSGYIQYVGKNLPNYKKRKIRELFQDFEIEFGDASGNDILDVKIIDCSEGFRKMSISRKKNIVFLRNEDHQTFDYYSEEFIKTGKIFRWIKLWEYRWMITLN
jgi:glycosyltransferase involved in cell wall biosynthesis